MSVGTLGLLMAVAILGRFHDLTPPGKIGQAGAAERHDVFIRGEMFQRHRYDLDTGLLGYPPASFI